MRLTIFFLFLISLNIQAQENITEVFIDKAELSPSLTLLNTSNTNEGIIGGAVDNNIVDHRKFRKYKERTVHAPMNALTLSELRQLQGVDLKKIDALTEENNKVIIGTHGSESTE
ncbi:hypothetical protein POV26_06110 [Aequorivita todarodis]|uniref:hypothetical protein n=1 Tax=Aequorivita todarodis TaxID=2036821 RepID=UPI00234FC813|nr:hypothetical protein [Aequorivita todarodis]MDC8000601.1 hypothetical protein [Aequorivita todarodis]